MGGANYHSVVMLGRSLAACLTAAAAAILLCWHQRTERSVCMTLWAAESGAGPGFMGTKTPYSILKQIQEEELGALEATSVQQDQHGCQLIKMYAVVRHGARYATAKRTAETDKLKAMLIDRLGLNNGEVHKQSSTLQSSQSHGDLSELGMIEQYCLAIRLKAKLPQLLQQPYSKHHYNFRTSQTSRTFKSALSFAAGLFQGQGPLDGYQPVDVVSEPLEDDSLLRFDEHRCPLYDKLVTRNTSIVKEWQSSPSVLAIRKHLQSTLDPGSEFVELSLEDVWSMYKLCVDDSVQLERESHWCQLLSPSHLQTLHQISNIKAFWRKGGGFPITGLRSVHLVKDLLEFMINISETKVALRFGHSETLLPLLAFLDIPTSGLRDFDTTRLTPFSANAIFYLHNCSSQPGHKLFLGLDLNERPVEIGLCPVHARGERRGLCPLQLLVQVASEKSQQWKSHHQLCALPQA